MIGDATGGDADFGVLGFGAATPLKDVWRYCCYPGDHLPEGLRPHCLVRHEDRVYRVYRSA